jgi:hypothetical protein
MRIPAKPSSGPLRIPANRAQPAIMVTPTTQNPDGELMGLVDRLLIVKGLFDEADRKADAILAEFIKREPERPDELQ